MLAWVVALIIAAAVFALLGWLLGWRGTSEGWADRWQPPTRDYGRTRNTILILAGGALSLALPFALALFFLAIA